MSISDIRSILLEKISPCEVQELGEIRCIIFKIEEDGLRTVEAIAHGTVPVLRSWCKRNWCHAEYAQIQTDPIKPRKGMTPFGLALQHLKELCGE